MAAFALATLAAAAVAPGHGASPAPSPATPTPVPTEAEAAPATTPVPTAAPVPALTPPARPSPLAGAAVPTPEATVPTAVAAPSTGVRWSELRYGAHKLFLSARTAVRAGAITAAALARVLRRPPRGRAVPIPPGGAVAVSVASELPFGRDEDVTLWLDPGTGAAIGGEKTSTGGSPYHKLMRYTDGGLFTWRSAPRNATEAAGGPGGWSEHSDYLTEAVAPAPAGVPVTDSYVLLYLVSAARLDEKDGSLRVVTLNRDRYVEITFAAGALSYQRASFTESWPGGGARRDGNVLVRTVRGTAKVVGGPGDGSDADLGFLGMRGALTMFVEVGTGVPISFSGRVDYAGTLTVRLTHAALLTAPPVTPASPPPAPAPPAEAREAPAVPSAPAAPPPLPTPSP